jgi:trans-aconitate methyltransferase
MLPEDTKSRKAQINEKLQQTQVNDHFAKAQPENKPEPYSDELFKEAALQWLVETDQVCIALPFFADVQSDSSYTNYLQPIRAFEHPSFKTMIAIASRAARGVAIPNRKQTRAQIIALFKKQMKALRKRLTVGSSIQFKFHNCLK